MVKAGTYRIDLGGGGWFYLGSSANLARREGDHRRKLERGDHCNKIAQRVFDKYGVFEFHVLGRYPVDEILAREQLLLDDHGKNSKCANIALVAGRPMAGRKLSPEHREALSAAGKGRKCSDATRAKLSAALKGRKFSPEWLANMAAAQTGKKVSDAARANMSAAQKGRKMPPFTPEHRANMSAARRGKTLPPEHRAKISATKTGKKRPPRTPEWCAAISAAKIGKKHTPEHCAAISAAKTGIISAVLTNLL